jgi:hypothetical protein
MVSPEESVKEQKARLRSSVGAVSALYKLLGWIVIGVGAGFSVTLFSLMDTDKVLALTGALVCIMLTVLIFALVYGFAETLKILLEIEDDCDRVADKIGMVADRIEIIAEEPLDSPKVEEIESADASQTDEGTQS